MINRLHAWLSYFLNPNNPTHIAIGEDFRKMGVGSVVVALIGLFIPTAERTFVSSLLLAITGVMIWLIGVLITHQANMRSEQ